MNDYKKQNHQKFNAEEMMLKHHATTQKTGCCGANRQSGSANLCGRMADKWRKVDRPAAEGEGEQRAMIEGKLA
jgi:hypothetical protein